MQYIAEMDNYSKYADIFPQLQGKMVSFHDSTGQILRGIVADYLSEGVFVIRTQHGEQDVHPNQIDWKAVKDLYSISPEIM